MKASSSIPAFRLTRARGFVKMSELIRFAQHIGRIMGQEITIEGADSARPLGDGSVAITAAPITEGDKTTEVNLNVGPKPQYTFPRNEGLAVWQHLAAYHEWLWPQIQSFKLQSNNLTETRTKEEVRYLKFNNAA